MYFNPRSPRGGATYGENARKGADDDFNPRSPRGGATDCIPQRGRNALISIHAPHEGERQVCCAVPMTASKFQSTLPTRGSDIEGLIKELTKEISIHAPHEGERPQAQLHSWSGAWISIHAPHEGERRCATSCCISGRRISIHAPHEGERHRRAYKGANEGDFNPRSPRGGATLSPPHGLIFAKISIHAPHEGERPQAQLHSWSGAWISIHAPHEGERRCATSCCISGRRISIHAPHEGERRMTVQGQE